MKTLTFEGASDDLVEITGDDTYREVSWYNEDVPWTCVVRDPATGDAIEVLVWYRGRGGTWLVGVALFDEDLGWPEGWEVRVIRSPDIAYSARLELTVPDGTGIVTVSEELE